jgi:hypothetical protein
MFRIVCVFWMSGTGRVDGAVCKEGAANPFPEDLHVSTVIQRMAENDKGLNNVVIDYLYTDMSVRPDIPLGPRGPIRKFLGDKANKLGEYEYIIIKLADIDSNDLPEAKVLFGFALVHADDIKARTVPPGLTPDELRWFDLLASGKVEVSQKKKAASTHLSPPLNVKDASPSSEQMAFRNGDFAIISNPGGNETFPRKWSSIGGKTTSMRASPNGAKREWMKDERELRLPLNPYQELALWRILTMGVGFGSKIADVHRAEIRGDVMVIDCDIVIWPDNPSAAILEVDSNWIVRKADIDANVTKIEITTTGVREYSTNLKTAASGTFGRRFKTRPLHTSPAFSMEVKSIKFDLSDAELKKFADFTAPAGEHVSDVTPGKPRKAARVAASHPNRSTMIAILVANGIIFIGIWIILFVRWRRSCE